MNPAARGLTARAAEAVTWARSTLIGRCLRRFREIDGQDRTLAIAGQGFTTLVPLLIVVAAVAGDDAVAQRLVDRFQLDGVAADAVHLLFTRPPGATATFTILGAVVLFYSTLSLTRALQRTWEAAWELPQAGVRGTLHALSGVALLVTQILVLAVLTNAFSGWPGADVVGFAVRVVIAAGIWLELQHLLLSRRVPRAELVAGAIVAGLGQVAASVYSAVWMPRLIAVDAARYGVIGVTFALLTWLIVIAAGLVAAAVVSAEIRLRRERRAAARPAETPDAVAESGTVAATGAVAGPDDAPPPPPPGRLRARLTAIARADRTDRYGAVLLLVVTTVAWTAAAPSTWWAHLLVVGLQTAVLYEALRASLAAPRFIGVVVGLWSAGAVVAVVAAAAGADGVGVAACLSVLLLAATLGALLRRLTRQPIVSLSTAAGAISAYLLLGLLFTYFYAFLDALGATPLSGGRGEITLNENLYFAFTTLTTTGYGDFAPVTNVARATAVVEALLGQLYLVTVLALVVSRMRPVLARSATPGPPTRDG